MVNLLGDLWKGGEPDWEVFLKEPGCFLHLYGKEEAKAGRKMGHATLIGKASESVELALTLRDRVVR
jgi:5-(carboxyamino)imidazole ribonucleotide synthase